MAKIDKQHLTDVAVNLAEIHGYRHVTRDEIARVSGASQGTVTNYLGTMRQIRKLIVRQAIKRDIKSIIAQAITYGEPQTQRIPIEERLKALQSVL